MFHYAIVWFLVIVAGVVILGILGAVKELASEGLDWLFSEQTLIGTFLFNLMVAAVVFWIAGALPAQGRQIFRGLAIAWVVLIGVLLLIQRAFRK